MKNINRSNLVAGLALILFGGAWLAFQFIPGLNTLFSIFSWPMIIIAVGMVMLILGLALGAPQMAIPASIISGIGFILFWQNATGRWESWIYAWVLFPAFVGIGQVLAALAGDISNRPIYQALRQIVVSVTLFLVFASLWGGLNLFGRYWPILIIFAGILLMIEPLFTRAKN